MKTYIITCKKLESRLAHAIQSANALTNDVTPVKAWDAEELSQKAIEDYGNVGKELWDDAVKTIAPILIANALTSGGNRIHIEIVEEWKGRETINTPSWMKSRRLSSGEVSVLMKHFWAIGSIANGQDEYGLILEDDVRIHERSVEKFKLCLEEFIGQNGDYLDLAGGCNLNSGAEDIRFDYCSLLRTPRTRTNAAYIVKRDLAREFANKFIPLIFPIDWHLQYIMPKSAKIFWANEPPLIHGSEQGLVTSWRQ